MGFDRPRGESLELAHVAFAPGCITTAAATAPSEAAVETSSAGVTGVPPMVAAQSWIAATEASSSATEVARSASTGAPNEPQVESSQRATSRSSSCVRHSCSDLGAPIMPVMLGQTRQIGTLSGLSLGEPSDLKI